MSVLHGGSSLRGQPLDVHSPSRYLQPIIVKAQCSKYVPPSPHEVELANKLLCRLEAGLVLCVCGHGLAAIGVGL